MCPRSALLLLLLHQLQAIAIILSILPVLLLQLLQPVASPTLSAPELFGYCVMQSTSLVQAQLQQQDQGRSMGKWHLQWRRRPSRGSARLSRITLSSSRALRKPSRYYNFLNSYYYYFYYYTLFKCSSMIMLFIFLYIIYCTVFYCTKTASIDWSGGQRCSARETA